VQLQSRWNAHTHAKRSAPSTWYDPANYFVDPPHEEFIDHVIDTHGNETGYVSRNRYGALILNTDRLMILDVDRSAKPWQRWTAKFMKLLGRQAPSQESQILAAAQANVADNYRIYRTFGGWRLMLVNRPVDGIDSFVETEFQRFAVDPFYAQLCRRQKTFRARLTPKPWRCDCSRPPNNFPFERADERLRFDAWQAEYSQCSSGYRTCELIAGFENAIDTNLQPLVALHDGLCKIESDAPLA
jgi:hypothetical protein